MTWMLVFVYLVVAYAIGAACLDGKPKDMADYVALGCFVVLWPAFFPVFAVCFLIGHGAMAVVNLVHRR